MTTRRWKNSQTTDDFSRPGQHGVLSDFTKQLLEDTIKDKWSFSVQKAVREINKLPQLRNVGIFVTQTTAHRVVHSTD
jgi:hypothetical protein